MPKRAKEATFHMSERDAAAVFPVPLRLELYGVVGGDAAQCRVRRGDGVPGASGVDTPSTAERPVLVGTTSVVAALSDGYVRREALLQDPAGRTVCRASVDLWLQETHRDGGLATTSDETAADSAAATNGALPLPAPPAAVPPYSRRTLSVAYSPDTMPAPPSASASERVSRTSVSGRPHSAHYTSLHAGLCGSEESCAAPSYDADPRTAFCGTVPQDGARRIDVLRMRSSCEPTPPAWVQTPEDPFRALGHVLKTLQKTVGFLLGLDAQPASVRVPGVPAGDALPFKHIHDRLVYAGDLYGQEWHRRGGDCATATASPRLSTAASVAPSSPVLSRKEDSDGSLIKRLWDEERGWIDAKKQELEQLEAALMARERAVSRREELLRRRVPASIYGSSTLDQQLGQIESLHTWHTVCEHNAALSQSLLRYAPGGDGASVGDAPTKEELDSGLARIAGAQVALRESSDFQARLQREAGKEETDRRLLITEEGRARKVLRERVECAADDAAAAAEAAAAAPPPRLVTSPPEPVQESREVKGATRDAADDADPLHRQPPPPEPATSPLLPHQGQREDDDDDGSLHGVEQASPATPAPPLTAASPAGPLSADVAGTDDEASPVLMTSPSLTPLNRRGVAGLERERGSEERGAVAMSHGSIATATVSGASTTSGYVNLLQQALQMDAPKDGRKSPSLELVQKALVMTEQTSSPVATEADTVRGGRTEDGLPEREPSKPLPPSSEPVPATHDLAFDIPDDDDEDRFSIDTQ